MNKVNNVNMTFWTALKIGFWFTIGAALAFPALVFALMLLGIGGMSL